MLLFLVEYNELYRMDKKRRKKKRFHYIIIIMFYEQRHVNKTGQTLTSAIAARISAACNRERGIISNTVFDPPKKEYSTLHLKV
jgi:hypothetical protein